MTIDSVSMDPFSEKCWIVNADFKQFGVHLGGRMTIIEVSENRYWVHSPVFPSAGFINNMKHGSTITAVVMPNLYHHKYLNHFQRLFPKARYFAPSGYEEKVKSARIDEEISEKNQRDFGIQAIPILGMPRVNEWVFFHKLSKTLIISDLLFNICNSQSWMTRIVMWLNGAYNKLAITRVSKSFVEDKSLFIESIKAIIKLEFSNIILSHGTPIKDNAKDDFKLALSQFVNISELKNESIVHV